MHYAQSLPYANLLDKEAETWLNTICTNLVISVKAKDFTIGAVAWIKRLANYLDMKHAVPREIRASLSKLLYEMVIMPGMELALVELWANSCIRLIRHKKRLGPEDLQLEWRPLYELIERILFPKSRQRTLMSESKHIVHVLRLVGYAQRFFSPNAAEEILAEFLPKFTTHSISDAIKAQGYLVLFLPIEYQSTHTIHAQNYLPTIFSLWSMFSNSPIYDTQFAYLVSCIAEHNLDQGSNIGLFTKQQIKTIFTVGLRMMNLPVGSRSDGSSSSSGAAGGATTGYGSQGLRIDSKAGNSLLLRKKPEKFKSLARFIVYTIMPDENNQQSSYTLSLLSDMIQATELYYHPSNHGPWSYMLTTFARHLAAEFLKRWREEQEEDCNVPPHRRLTLALRKEFVLILRPVTYLSMFGKDQYIVGASQSTLKYLSWLEPSLIFPGLLERIYPSLETLTETHRTSSALSILTDIALPLFSRDNYPAGGKHLLPLLHLAIPGIDMNDPIKTIASLMFISTSLMSIPICDMTQHQDGYYPTEEYTDNPFAELSKDTEDYLVKASTGEFEEWLAKFLNRAFTIFENLPQENRKKQGSSHSGATMETGLTQILLHTCDVVFGQLSDELYDLALRLVIEFITDRVLPNAVRAVGLLCDAIASINPKKAAKVFLPLCISNIRNELEHGAAATVAHAASSNLIQSDSTFHWYQNILFSVVSMLGAEILPYKQDIIDITHLMIQQCRSRRGIMWTGKLIRSVLSTTLNIYPKEFRSLNPSQWNDKEFMSKQSHQVWGQPGDPANLEIQWHTPSETEKNFALEYLDQFLKPSMHRLEKLMDDTEQLGKSNHEISNEFCRHLAVVRNCLMGSGAMIANDGENINEDTIMKDVDGIKEEEDELQDFIVPRLEVGYAFSDPTDPRTQKACRIRYDIGQLIHQLSNFFRNKREDDVESIKILIKIARTFLSERGVEKSQFDRSKSGYSYAKCIGKTPLCKKRYPRNLLIRRAYNHHLLRLRQNVHARQRTSLHDAILNDLLEMSLGSYAEIRKISQTALSVTARCFRQSKSLIVPVLLDALQPLTPADRMKGALYLFTHKSILMPCLRHWKFIPSFVMAICNAQHQDKLTIQELIREVYTDYVSYIHTYSFHVITPDYLDSLLSALSPTTVKTDHFQQKIKSIQKLVESRLQNNRAQYHKLIDSLIDFLLDSRVHWRYAQMTANFIELFLSNDVKPSARLAAFANNATLSELPSMRFVGISTTIQLLLYIKQRTFAAGNETLLITGQVRNPLKVNIQVQDPSNFQMGSNLLEASYQALTPVNANSSVLVDDATLGWYVWPKSYTAYKVNNRDFLFETVEPDSQEAFNEFQKVLTSSEYWSKLCVYFSQEVNQKQEDRFNLENARLISSIFQVFGDRPLSAAKEHIEKLCQATDQKNSQRAASEILGGLIRGTKHWNVTKLSSVWIWLKPLLQNIFNGITPDSLLYWDAFIKFCATRRDPRRIQPLIDLILEAELDPTSYAAFNEARKLLLVRALIVSLKWKFKPLICKILPTYINNIQHPYKQVREVIGVNINELLQLEWVPSYPSVHNLLKANSIIDGVGNVPTTLNAEQSERMKVVVQHLDNWLTEMTTSGDIMSSTTNYAHASKTILCWLYEAFSHASVSGTLPYITSLFPKLFIMQEFNDDQDLQLMAGRILSLVARINYPSSMLPTLIDEFLTTLTTSSSWHIRIRALPVLQIFFFKNLFTLNSTQVLRIMEVIGQMLMDTQIEVRQLASVTLGGLVRCSQRDAIQTLLAQFIAKIQVKIPKRKRDEKTGKNVEPEGYAEAVLQKHSGVLGISCLINAFPYEVPEWMPSILCQLAECMSDPAAEIQTTIRKTFSDFRRTHSDTWHEDMLKFNEDQLSMLSDMLISPSYYA
ncbi:uncharacterized protein BX663DRAFT_425475 [Cokeromyces recurvatus]|uniref:uncharacterized protein n=1 Tax=Cokeromyces recurvatus TaxID=90255 RepID=UPI0022204E95|nr:uncharacterized protein BX663DRAFT_425475 [Cokeromyces recurvatus]KAI7908029.1 hypothetical protein BX663DRAFT_425475 [Cokeromyces recurvatus]